MKSRQNKSKKILSCFIRCSRILFGTTPYYTCNIIICIVLIAIQPSVSVMIMRNIINSIQQKDIPIQEILFLAAIYIFVDITNGLILKLVSYLSFIVEKKSSINVSTVILEKTKELDLSDFENMNTYDLIQRAQNESNGKIFGYFMSFLSIFQALIIVISNFLIVKSWSIFIVLFLAIITLIRMIFLIKLGGEKHSILRERTHKERERWYYQFLLTNDIAFKEIKIYDLYQYFIDKFKNLSNIFYDQDKNISKKQFTIDTLFSVIDSALSGVVFCLLIISSKIGRLMIGDIVGYMSSISNIKNNIENFCLSIANICESTLYVSQLFELLDINSRRSIENGKVEIDQIKRIELINVNFKYSGKDEYALKNINLLFEKNKMVFLVGKNGSGKSTLVKLISGYYQNYEGDILVNGINLREINLKQYQEKLGILLQDFMMYELPLRSNVALSNLRYYNDDKEIGGLLHSVGFTKYDTLDMQLGYWFENGHQLSRGEWLKIALARAFMKDADIYIADEPNSSLDAISESEIMQYFRHLIRGKICIIVTHKMSNIVTSVGNIIVMNNGQVMQMGTHDYLMKNCSIYSELFHCEPSNN